MAAYELVTETIRIFRTLVRSDSATPAALLPPHNFRQYFLCQSGGADGIEWCCLFCFRKTTPAGPSTDERIFKQQLSILHRKSRYVRRRNLRAVIDFAASNVFPLLSD